MLRTSKNLCGSANLPIGAPAALSAIDADAGCKFMTPEALARIHGTRNTSPLAFPVTRHSPPVTIFKLRTLNLELSYDFHR